MEVSKGANSRGSPTPTAPPHSHVCPPGLPSKGTESHSSLGSKLHPRLHLHTDEAPNRETGSKEITQIKPFPGMNGRWSQTVACVSRQTSTGYLFEGNTDFYLQVCTMQIRIAHDHLKVEKPKDQHTVGSLYGS